MSARRWFQGALLLTALGMTAAVRPSHSPQIVARVGGNLAGRVGDTLNVPITVDLTGAAGVRLGGYRMTIRFNPNVLSFQDGSNGTFAQPLVNTDSAGYGMLRMTAIQPSGADGVVTLGVGRFRVLSDTGESNITVTFEEMSGVAPTFDDLLPLLTVVNGTFCHASGKWGDVDGDGQANSRDALVALSQVVGIALDTIRIDTIMVPDSGARYDTLVTLRPGLADVDGDAQVTSRDALIIMSYAVGLPVPGFRIGLAAAGACGGSGLGLSIAVAPDTLELQSGQTANAVVSARDASGNPASLNGATWTSSNTAVAGVTSPGFGIEARDAGVAVLTARLGASYRASMVVRVVAHRTQWFVDVTRSQAALQTGSPAFPFAFIQDAFDAGRDGDTINVAPGNYEEVVSSDISVFLRGDPVHPPVIDSRGSSSYGGYNTGLSAGSRLAPMRIENLRIEHGGISVSSHDFFARNVHIEASDSASPALYFYSALTMPPGAPPAGVRPGAADLPNDTGNIVLDSVTVHGPWGVWGEAIYVGLADTVIIRNSAVSRDSTIFPACNGNGPAGIKVNQASRTEISGTTVLNAPCVGIEVYQSAGSARISGNTVDRTGGAGIAVSLPVVVFDHNTVTRIISGSGSAQAAGILVYDNTIAQSVTSVGDVIRGSGDRGFAVWGARSATIDALTVDTTGLDNTNTSAGVEFWGGHLTLTNSRISNVLAYGAGVLTWTDTTASVLESRHNAIWNIQGPGLYSSEYTPGMGCAPPLRSSAPVARGAMGGCSGRGPDSLISVGDTILYTGGSGIEAQGGRRLFVDADVIDSVGGDGVLGYYMTSTLVQNSLIRMAGSSGVRQYDGDSVSVRHSVIVGAYEGVNASQFLGSARIYGNRVDSSANVGVDVQTNSSGVVVSVDSNHVASSAVVGVALTCDYCLDTASVTHNHIIGNALGVQTSGFLGGFLTRLRYNTIEGNLTGGVANLGWSSDTLRAIVADSNYWGDTLGPLCTGGATGCDITSTGRTGDSILTLGVNFIPWLTAPDASVVPAPRNVRPVASRPAPVAVASRPPRQAAAASRPPFALRPARPQPRPSGPMMSWRKGQPPRPAKVHHPS